MRSGIILAALVVLSACSTIRNDLDKQFTFGTDSERLTRKVDERGLGRKVNAYLWRASLDVVAGTPLEVADPRQGLIISDWYTSPGAPNDRQKVRIHVVDDELRADTFRVSVARQTLKEGAWVNAASAASMTQTLEENILTKARDIQRTSLGE